MKSRLLILTLLLLGFASCKKEENKIYYEGGTPPALNASTNAPAGNVVLEPGSEANTAITFKWTNPEYQFTTGINSQGVTYTLEMDTAGGNFNSSTKYATVIGNDLSKTYTVGDLNAILGNSMLLQLNPRKNYTIQTRIISTVGSALKLVSNVASFTTKPFAPPPKVTPPASGELYITGDATDGGWMVGGGVGVPVPAQKFTQVSPTYYTIVVHLTANKHFLLLPVNGDWGNKYACHDKTTQPPSGGDFGYNGNNGYWNDDLVGPTADGNYKITVDFQIGKYTLVKQ